VKKLGGEPDPVLQVDDDATVPRESVQPIGAQAVRAVRLQLDFAVEAVSDRHERASHHGLTRALRRPPHSEELPLDEGVLERTAPRPRLGAERADQETPRKPEPLGPLNGGACRPLRAQYRRRVAELERERAAQVEVLVPEKIAHVLLHGEHGTRELGAGEEKSEAPFVWKGEAVGFALDRPEPGLLPAITRIETHDRAVPLQGEPPSRRHLEEARVHSESRDLAPARVEPGLAAPLVEEERASRRRIERTETAREREVLPVAVAVGVVEQVESQPPTQELRIGVQDLARRTVGPLRHGERHLLAQSKEVLLLDRYPVVTLPARPAERTRDLRGPRVVRVHHHVDLALDAFDRLRRDRHRPEQAQETQIPLGLRHLRRFEPVSLGEQELPADDLHPRHAVNRVGDPRQKGSLGVLEDVLGLDPDAPDARAGLRRSRPGQLGRKENAQKEDAGPDDLRADRPGTRIHGGNVA
jgi:hypothetical protein